MESGGGDGYKMQWQKVVVGLEMTDYIVRVKVCDTAMPELNCKTYVGPTSKPTGLLHKYGEGNGMYFGLLTGSYIKNTQGGVLRRALGSIESELNANGTYKNSSTTYKLNGIISTIDRLRIDGFNYSSQSYGGYDANVVTDSCGWITTSPMTVGKCQNFGAARSVK